MAQGFTRQSLAEVTVPALLIGAGVDIGDMPAEKETGWLAENLPAESTQTHMIPERNAFQLPTALQAGCRGNDRGRRSGRRDRMSRWRRSGPGRDSRRGFWLGHRVSGSSAVPSLRSIFARAAPVAGRKPRYASEGGVEI